MLALCVTDISQDVLVVRFGRFGRWSVLPALALVSFHMPAAPAAARGGGPDAAFYQSQITEIVPALVGVSAAVDPAGEWIELTYTGPSELVMLGYLGEAHPRVTAGSVEENSLSQSAYLNRALFADVPTAAMLTSAAPAWRLIATTGTVRWHDHRIHWMGQTRPPEVAADRTPHTYGRHVGHPCLGGFDAT